MQVEAGLSPGLQSTLPAAGSPLTSLAAGPLEIPAALPHVGAVPAIVLARSRSDEEVLLGAREFAEASTRFMTRAEVINAMSLLVSQIDRIRQSNGAPTQGFLKDVRIALALQGAPVAGAPYAACVRRINAAITAHEAGQYKEAQALWDQAAQAVPTAGFSAEVQVLLPMAINLARNETRFRNDGEAGMVMAAWHDLCQSTTSEIAAAERIKIFEQSGDEDGAMDLLSLLRDYGEEEADEQIWGSPFEIAGADEENVDSPPAAPTGAESRKRRRDDSKEW